MGKHVRENHRSSVIFRILALLFEIFENRYRACVLLIHLVETFFFFPIDLCLCSNNTPISPFCSHVGHSFNSLKWRQLCACISGTWVATTSKIQRIMIVWMPYLPCPTLSYPFCSTKRQKSSILNGEGRKRFITVMTLYFTKGNYNYQVPSWFL